jgi:hypothetical protein
MIFFLLLSKATKLGTFHWPLSKMISNWPPNLELSIGHQAWNFPLTIKQDVSSLTIQLRTFNWPPSWGFFPTFLFPLLSKGSNLDHLSLFSNMIFDLNI